MNAIENVLSFLRETSKSVLLPHEDKETLLKLIEPAAVELKELQAAQELAELRKQQIDEMNRSYELVMREGCTDDEMHCTCVPALRKRIEELENTVREEVLKASEK